MNNEFIRALCLSFPGVTEDIKWQNNLCFLVGGKIFCIANLDGEFGVSFKVNSDEPAELTVRNGIIPAPYLARYDWVLVKEKDALSKKEWEHFLLQSYGIVKSKLTKKKKAKKMRRV